MKNVKTATLTATLVLLGSMASAAHSDPAKSADSLNFTVSNAAIHIGVIPNPCGKYSECPSQFMPTPPQVKVKKEAPKKVTKQAVNINLKPVIKQQVNIQIPQVPGK